MVEVDKVMLQGDKGALTHATTRQPKTVLEYSPAGFTSLSFDHEPDAHCHSGLT